MKSEIIFIPYRSEFDAKIAELDSVCEPVRKRLSWINRYLLSSFDPQGASLAFHNDRLIGSAMIVLGSYRLGPKEVVLGYLSDVAVHPDYQKKGLGRKLSLRSIDFAKQEKADGVILFTSHSNTAAYSLYQKLGCIELTKQYMMVWNQSQLHNGVYAVRKVQYHEKKEIISLVRNTFKNYELYCEIEAMMFNSQGDIELPGVSSYVILDKDLIIGYISVLNYDDIWRYKTPKGLSAPLIIYNISVQQGYSRKDVLKSFLHSFYTQLIQATAMLIVLADATFTDDVSLYRELGFEIALEGIWMGMSLNSDKVLKTLERPMYNGFPL